MHLCDCWCIYFLCCLMSNPKWPSQNIRTLQVNCNVLPFFQKVELCSYCKIVDDFRLVTKGCRIHLGSNCANQNWLQDFSNSQCHCEENIFSQVTTTGNLFDKLTFKGHSTTMQTQFYPILTPTPPEWTIVHTI